MSVTASVAIPRRDIKVIGLISAGHFFSHFYMLLLPPLFPVLREVYGVGYTELGLAITVFSVTTGLTQAPVGFFVDRYGAPVILIAGLLLEALAIALIGFFPFYGALLAFMVLAGLANAVYHPANYTILNASIDQKRMGRAFSIHTFAGYLGDAMAPVTIIFLMSITDWQTGLALCALAGAAVALLLAFNTALLHDASRPGGAAAPAGATTSRTGLGLLFSLPILMGLLFFVGISLAGRGIGGFGVSALNVIYDAPLEVAGMVLSAYLFASPPGVLIGGWIADRVRRHDLVAALCFIIIACTIFAVAALRPSLLVIAVLFAIAGLFSGIVAPSRDMMIRSVTPPGQTGKVFGFVSTGFNIGGIIGPVMFGYILDHAEPNLLFWVIGGISLLTVVTVLETGRRGHG